MKRSIWYVAILITGLQVAAAQESSGGGEAYPNLRTNIGALERFRDNRFGMFIHWGPVSLRGTEISWSRGKEVSLDDYDSLYREFNPVLFNAHDWVKAAKNAGMKYIVITARHHDGFCLWDSAYTEYDMKNTPYGKGIVKDLSEECKRQNIDFGIYYSICDWWHEDYPVVYPDKNYEFHVEKKIKDPATKERMDRYVTYMKNQLEELIEAYDPSLIWFDGEWEWAWTHEMGMDLYAYLRGLKDDILINNRVDKGRVGMAGRTKSFQYAGDFATPEREIGKFDTQHAWESCITIANQWAWKPNDRLKSTDECIKSLVQTVGGDGNLLLNVGPMSDGRIEQRQIDQLNEIGNWLTLNGDAIFGTRGGPYLPTEKMVSTHKDNKIFLHLLDLETSELKVVVPKGYKIENVHYLNNQLPLNFKRNKQDDSITLKGTGNNWKQSVIVLEMDKSTAGIEPIKLNFK